MTEQHAYGATDRLPIDRETAIPIYQMVERMDLTRTTPTYRPGRVITDINIVQRWIDNDPALLLSKLGPGDNILVPIYRGSPESHIPYRNARGTEEKVPQFKRNLEFAIEAMKIVRSIIVANAGIETWMFDSRIRPTAGQWVANFIRASTEELRPLGIEPMYIYAETHKDCYVDKWVVRDTIIDLGVVQFCPMPYEMITQKWAHKEKEDIPYPILREYLSGGRFWGGVNWSEGLQGGMDHFLKFLGFEAGVMGEKYDE